MTSKLSKLKASANQMVNPDLNMTVMNLYSPGLIVPIAGEDVKPQSSGNIKQKEVGPTGKTPSFPIRATEYLNSSE